ncbi:MAG: membrane protein insertase YidC [Prevotella sp.]|nr:membrane protein insertase YidC [Prevotella sp.]
MNRNTLIGFSLIAVILIVFSWLNQPSQEEIDAYYQAQDSIAAVQAEQQKAQEQAEQKATEAQQVAAADSTDLFYPALSDSLAGESRLVTLKNDSLELTFNTKGGTIASAKILGHKDTLNNYGVTLFDAQTQQMSFVIKTASKFIDTKTLNFTPKQEADGSLTMTAQAQGNGSLTFRYRLGPDYLLHFSLQAQGLADQLDPTDKTMTILWQYSVRQQEKGFTFENQRSALTYKFRNGGTDYLNETSEKQETTEEATDWIAFKNQYFSAVLISKDGFNTGAELKSTPQEKQTRILKLYEAKLQTAFDPTGAQPSEFEIYLGPNDFHLIQDVEEQSEFGLDLDLEKLVYLGWPLFRYINRWFTLPVFDGLTKIGLPMGIVLILITLLLKAITFPMVKKSYMSSAKMRVLKPKLEEATKQYDKPEDQMQKQQAMMSLYAKYGVSPLGGCLPMLIQMPIWIAMFNFVPNAIQLRRESFLWMDDLSTYDPIPFIGQWDTYIWGLGDHLSLTCILFCVSNLAYSYLTMRQQRDQMVGQQAEQMKMMQWMMYIMPLMFFFIFNDYSSGLNFYYFISLFFSAAIMWVLRKTTDDEKLLAKLEANYKENQNNPKKMGGLAARLEALQKQAAEMQKQQQMRKK